MPIVNFTIPPTLDKRITAVVKKQGFASKAEFFRFAAMQYIEHVDQDAIEQHWIFKNPKALASLLKGIDDSAHGRVKSYRSVDALFRSLHARNTD